MDIDPELHIDVIERNWSRLLAAHQEKDSILQDEIKRLDRLQRLAEKVVIIIIIIKKCQKIISTTGIIRVHAEEE